MKLLSLGHSAFLLDMDGVRILGDPWITDYCIGDLMGRVPRLEVGDLGPVDAIWISHSHTDHLDAASLLRLRAVLDPFPVLLLPVSLRFLEDVFREFLPGVEIQFLNDSETVDFKGIALSAFFDPGSRGTNEDDVMLLVADNGREVFVNEADALLPLYEPGVREFIGSLFTDRETGCFLTTRNELAVTMAMLGAEDAADREARLSVGLEEMWEEIEALYAPIDDEPGLWDRPGLVRLVGGQGMAFPADLGTDWNRVLFPVGRKDRVRLERQVAESLGVPANVEEFEPGLDHVIESGGLAGRDPFDGLTLLDDEASREFDPTLELFTPFPAAPLADEPRDVAEQHLRIRKALNERFLPWLIGAAVPPIEHLLSGNDGTYRIRIRYGTPEEFVDEDFVISFAEIEFGSAAPDGDPDEHYWANDLEDFFDGRADEFSIFVRKPLGGRSQRFWHCLGLPLLNQDLVARKHRFHFERAAAGHDPAEWVLPFYRAIGMEGPSGD
jgi:hypothetical protein